ncbi:MAG: hypothetical protein MHPSP_000230 [Paramarteilia canceri]
MLKNWNTFLAELTAVNPLINGAIYSLYGAKTLQKIKSLKDITENQTFVAVGREKIVKNLYYDSKINEKEIIENQKDLENLNGIDSNRYLTAKVSACVNTSMISLTDLHKDLLNNQTNRRNEGDNSIKRMMSIRDERNML